MSARQKPIVLAGVCLLALSACDSRQAPVEPAVKTEMPTEKAVLPSSPEVFAPAENFLLETAVNQSDTFESLQKQYGEINIAKSELPGAEGDTAQGWILYPNHPEKKLLIYTNETNSHPGSLLVDEAGSKWQLANSVKLGTDSNTLESLNKKPFTFYGFYWDYGGAITDWNGGELSKKSANGSQINIHLCPPEDPKLPDNYLMGDGTFNSDNPLAVKFPPVVCKLGVYFAAEEKK